MIVISSSQAVRDLLEKRSAIYSSRPEAFLGMEIASGGLRVGLMVRPPPDCHGPPPPCAQDDIPEH